MNTPRAHLSRLLLLAVAISGIGMPSVSEAWPWNRKKRETPVSPKVESPDDGKALQAAEDSLKIRSLLDRGDQAGAEKLAQKSVQKRPNDAEAHFLLGKVLLAKGERKAARQAFEKARTLNPTYAAYGRALAELLDQDAAEAIKGDDPGTAIAAWKQCLTLKHKPRQTERNLAEAFRRLGEILLRENRRSEAEDAFREAAALLPDNPVPKLDLALLLVQDDRLQEAQKELAELTATHPNFEDGLVAYAKVLKRMGEAREAMVNVKRALTLAPANAQALALKTELEKEVPVRQEESLRVTPTDEPDAALAHKLGTLENAGNLTGQATLLRNALEENPNLLWAKLRLAILCDRLGNASEALSLATEYNAERPDDLRGQFMLARARHLTGDLQGALGLLLALVNDGKSNLQIFDELGQVYAKLGKFDQARANWRKALQIDPEYPNALFNFGQLAMEEGKVEDATSLFERALARDPANLKFRFFAGLNLKQAGKAAEAKTVWQQARPFFMPGDPYAVRIAAALGEKLPAAAPQPAQPAPLPQPGTTPSTPADPVPTIDAGGPAQPTVLTGRSDATPATPAVVGSQAMSVGTLPAAAPKVITTMPLEESLYQTALAAARNGEYDQAAVGFREVLAKNPGNLNAWINLGNVHTSTGKPADAAACYLKALKVKRDNQFARQALEKSYGELGLNPGGKNLLTGADMPFDPSVERQRSNPRSFEPLAKAFAANGLGEEARTVLKIAVDENPEQADLRLLEGEVLQAIGQPGLAEKAFQKAIEIDKANPAGHIKLGDFLAATGRRDAAYAEYQIIMRSKDSDPDSLLDVADRLVSMGLAKEAQEVRMRVKGMNLSEQQMQRLQQKN